MSKPWRRHPILISSCLLGIRCRYDAEHSLCKGLVDLLPKICAVPVCPEQMGGLPTPRTAANIIDGHGPDVLTGSARCINLRGEDVTESFIKGAQEVLRLAHLTGARIFIGKSKSPSCGKSTPYCEAPGGVGIGITASLLIREGLHVFDLDDKGPFPLLEFNELMSKIYG